MSQHKLPPEWCNAKLGDVVQYGKTQKCVLSDVSDSTWVLELEDVEKESSRVFARKTAAERPFKSTKNIFYKGNVLYGKLRPYLNKVVLADEQGVCTTEIIPLDAEPFVLNRYLFYWLKTHDFLSYVNEVSYGVNMPRLGTKDGISAPMVLAPLVEQQIIADKLDTLLAQVDNTKARLERIPAILKRFRQSVLAAAVSGRLTEEWRKEHGVSIAAWKQMKIGDVSIVATGKTPSRKESKYWQAGEIPWLTSASTGAIYTNSAEQYVTQFAVADCSLKIFPPGTLLLAMYGEGKTRGQVTELKISATCNQACAAVMANEKQDNTQLSQASTS
ncbi:restriction endonuclease subunit S [Halomonas colorata]|uniref:restriction endonuclease subunit S n=1 Tax=Halomonas colorata TaxID=2742615 RepID=UPI0021F80454|nr:restriction endonuclease subunit S [Halomonas colorata]